MNARLKSARAGAPSPAASTAPRTPVHTPPPKNNRPPKSTVTPKAAATPKSSGAHPHRLLTVGPRTVTAPPRQTRLGASRTVGIRDVRKRLVQTRNKNPLRKKPKMMMPRLFPALTFHRQVCQTRISQTLWKLFKLSREQIRHPFSMSVKPIITSRPPSTHGFHIESAIRRCLRFEPPVTNCWQQSAACLQVIAPQSMR